MVSSGKYPASAAVGVGHEEEPSPAVASANFSRREQARRCSIAHCLKAERDFGKSQIDVALNILREDDLRADLVDDAFDFWPEMAGISTGSASSSNTEWLAWVAGREDMNAVAPRVAIEGSQIVPYRRAIQGLVVHPRHESGRCMGFPLDETDSSISRFGKTDAELKSAVSGTERDTGELVGIEGTYSHKDILLRRLNGRSCSGSMASTG